MYALHGFAPGEVITELMLTHKHPDDRTRTGHTPQTVIAAGALLLPAPHP